MVKKPCVVNANFNSAIVSASLCWISNIENAGILLNDIIHFNKKRAVKTALSIIL
jgi:uncharacterized membrane protein